MKSNASKTWKWKNVVLIAGLALAVAAGVAVIKTGNWTLTRKSPRLPSSHPPTPVPHLTRLPRMATRPHWRKFLALTLRLC